MTLDGAIAVCEDILVKHLTEVEAVKVYYALVTFYDYYKRTCKAENSPTDKRSTSAWMNIPEASDKDPKQAIRTEIGELKDLVLEIEGRIKRIESVMFYGGK